jgi:hypothetical protein
VPDYGYRFSHCEGIDARGDRREMRIALRGEETRLRAVFEKFEHPLAGKIIINEISLNNRASGDWVELFNYTDHSVDLDGWLFTDSNNEFVFPGVSIAANDYLVLVEDSVKFRSVFPQTYNVLGGMSFGISKHREKLGLYASPNAAVDSVSYALPPTDSVFTLNLLLPSLDNSDLDNWEVRWGPGTPNAANPYYVQSTLLHAQMTWMQMGLAIAVIILCVMLLILRHRGVL